MFKQICIIVIIVISSLLIIHIMSIIIVMIIVIGVIIVNVVVTATIDVDYNCCYDCCYYDYCACIPRSCKLTPWPATSCRHLMGQFVAVIIMQHLENARACSDDQIQLLCTADQVALEHCSIDMTATAVTC